ncbi:hypothetical protein AB1Y20_008782 [Prymnesium parvum]
MEKEAAKHALDKEKKEGSDRLQEERREAARVLEESKRACTAERLRAEAGVARAEAAEGALLAQRVQLLQEHRARRVRFESAAREAHARERGALRAEVAMLRGQQAMVDASAHASPLADEGGLAVEHAEGRAGNLASGV